MQLDSHRKEAAPTAATSGDGAVIEKTPKTQSCPQSGQDFEKAHSVTEASGDAVITVVDDVKSNASETIDEEAEAEPERRMSKLNAIVVAIPLMAAIFVIAMDNYIVAPAMPRIAVELSANDASFAWIESSELLAWAVAVPIYGRGSDFLGRKPMILSAIVVCFVGTAIGGFATTIAMLIAGRTVQGLGCGGLAVMANICVADLFHGRQRAVYFSALGTLIGVGSAIGPILGGVLTSLASWRWCFWINLPIIAVAFVCVVAFLDLPSPAGSFWDGIKAIDWLGSFVMITATVLFFVGLQFGGTQFPWDSPAVISMMVLGALTFGVFLWIEGVVKRPLIPLHIFRNRSRAAILGVTFGQSLLSVGCKLFLPLYYQLTLGVSPLESSVYLLPFALLCAAIFPFIGWILKRTGRYRLMMSSGAPFLILGSGLMIASKPTTNWPLIIIPQILFAIGHGFTYQSPTIAFQAQLPRKDIGAGQSGFNFIRTFAEMTSAVLGQVIFQTRVAAQAGRLAGVDLNPALLRQLVSGEVISATSSLHTLPSAQQAIVNEVTAAAFGKMWLFYTVVAALTWAVSFAVADVELEK